MFDDFLVRALVAGIGVAIVAAPLGCFVVWRRLAYFGDTLAHAGLLGVALGLLLETNLTVAVFVVAVLVAVALVALQRRATLSSDALLGLLAHSTLAIGLVALSFMTWVRFDLSGLLFGDILSVSKMDLAIVYGGGAFVLVCFLFIWRQLFAAAVSPELALAEGMRPAAVNTVFIVLMALVIAIAMKIVGVLLITALLIIPAATARAFASGPEQMAAIAAVLGSGAVVGGLFASLNWDTPSGPSIVVAALVFFLVSLTPVATFVQRLLRFGRSRGGGVTSP